MSTQKKCPECGELISQNSKRCACGWSEAKSAGHTYSTCDKVRVRIGDSITWVSACDWKTEGRRCQMPATQGCYHLKQGLEGYCAWHFACLNTSALYSQDYGEFLKWREQEITPTHWDPKTKADRSPESVSPSWGVAPEITWAEVTGE